MGREKKTKYHQLPSFKGDDISATRNTNFTITRSEHDFYSIANPGLGQTYAVKERNLSEALRKQESPAASREPPALLPCSRTTRSQTAG